MLKSRWCAGVSPAGVWDAEQTDHESKENTNLSAYLAKDKFLHIHLLKGVVFVRVGACDHSESRSEPPPQREAPPKRLEVPEVRNGQQPSMNHGANVNTELSH